MSDEWLCQCDDPEHGLLGCTRGADEDESICPLCDDGIHDEDDDE